MPDQAARHRYSSVDCLLHLRRVANWLTASTAPPVSSTLLFIKLLVAKDAQLHDFVGHTFFGGLGVGMCNANEQQSCAISPVILPSTVTIADATR